MSDPWNPKPCPFCHETNVTLQVDFGDVFKRDAVYAVCVNGHRCKDQLFDRRTKGSEAAATHTAKFDWDLRAECPTPDQGNIVRVAPDGRLVIAP